MIWTRITFDAALQDTLDGLDKNQLTKNNEFELEHEEWNGAIDSLMMNVYSAGGSVSGNIVSNQELSTRTSMITSLMS